MQVYRTQLDWTESRVLFLFFIFPLISVLKHMCGGFYMQSEQKYKTKSYINPNFVVLCIKHGLPAHNMRKANFL